MHILTLSFYHSFSSIFSPSLKFIFVDIFRKTIKKEKPEMYEKFVEVGKGYKKKFETDNSNSSGSRSCTSSESESESETEDQ